MMHTVKLVCMSLILCCAALTPSYAGDSAWGAKVYKKCVACHMVGDKAKNRVGPHLNNLFTRAAASLEGYNYSKAMKKFAEDNPIWTEDLLDSYLANPRKMIKGSRMSFVGLRKEKDRAAVIAYLKQYTQ